MTATSCVVDGCDRGGSLRRGWCQSHYRRWWKYGDPFADGRVHRFGTLEQRMAANTRRTDGCWLWTGRLNHEGYGQISVKDQRRAAHRVALTLHLGVESLPVGMVVMHTCDVRHCVRPDHLRLGTHADNIADMVAKGRQARGERVGVAKISDADVHHLCEMRAAGASLAELATRFGITPAYACSLSTGGAYRTSRHDAARILVVGGCLHSSAVACVRCAA